MLQKVRYKTLTKFAGAIVKGKIRATVRTRPHNAPAKNLYHRTRGFGRNRRLADAAVAPQRHQLVLLRCEFFFELREDFAAVFIAARDESDNRRAGQIRQRNVNGRNRLNRLCLFTLRRRLLLLNFYY